MPFLLLRGFQLVDDAVGMEMIGCDTYIFLPWRWLSAAWCECQKVDFGWWSA